MESRRLGASGLDVSVFSLGSWLTYEYMDESEALAVIASGLAAGINFLDDARYDDRTGTAPLKTGYSEVLFGRLLRKGGWNREDLILANKLWFEFYPEQSVAAELDGSLERLRMGYLDLVYCAGAPESLPLLDLMRQLDGLIRAGKLRHWGVLNWPVEQIAEACRLAAAEGLSPPCAAQSAYSLLNRSPVEDPETQALCSSEGVGIVASYCLHGGLLSGKYNQAAAPGKGRFAESRLESMRQEGRLAQVERVIRIAQELACTPAQLALAYALRNRQVCSVLFGATKASQVEENLRALEIVPCLDQEVLTRLRGLTEAGTRG